MEIQRREFLKSLAVSGSLIKTRPRTAGHIDRAALVKRHNPMLRDHFS
jgi:hypothetical protein